MRYRKIILFFFSIAFFGYFFGVGAVKIAVADFRDDYHYVQNSTVIRITNFGHYVDSNDFRESPFWSFLDPATLYLGSPQTTSTINIPKDISSILSDDSGRIKSTNLAVWNQMAELYYLIPITDNSDNWNPDYPVAQKNFTAITDAVHRFNETTGSSTDAIALAPPTLAQEQSTTITAFYGGSASSAKTCYFYIGDGEGAYHLKSSVAVGNDGNCGVGYVWKTDATTFVGNHGVFVTFQEVKPADKYDKDSDIPTPNVHDVLNVCAKGSTNCKDISNTGHGGGLVTNRTFVTFGSSDPKPVISMYIADPIKADEYASSSKQCYFYIRNQKNDWKLKAAPAVKGSSENQSNRPNCTYTWDYSGSDPGAAALDHGFVVNILDANIKPDPIADPSASPNGVTVTVCPANTTNCQASGNDATGINGGDSSGGSGGSGGGSGSTGTFSGFVSGNDFMKLLRGELTNLEDAFSYYVVTNIIGLLALIAMIVGGIMVLSSGGDPAKAAKGKKTIMYGIIALVVAALSYGIVGYAIKLFNARK